MTPEQWDLLRAASRTFALSIERLPKIVGEPLGLAYLLLRVSDYLEDNDHMPAARKVTLLRLWDDALAGFYGYVTVLVGVAVGVTVAVIVEVGVGVKVAVGGWELRRVMRGAIHKA